MQITLETKNVRDAFAIVDYVPEKGSLETARIIRVTFSKGTKDASSGKMVLAASGSLVARAVLAAKGAVDSVCYCDRRVLATFLAQAGKDITFTVHNKAMTLQSGSLHLELQPLAAPTLGYEIWESRKAKEVPLSEPLMALLHEAGNYLDGAASRAHFSSAALRPDGSIFATDGNHLFVWTPTKSMSEEECYIPVSLAALLKTKAVSLLQDAKGVGLRFGTRGTVYQVHVGDIRKEYPLSHLQGLVAQAKSAPTLIRLRAGTLASTCDFFSKFTFNARERKCCVVTKTEKGIRCTMALTAGEATRDVECENGDFPAGLLPVWDIERLARFAGFPKVGTDVEYADTEMCHVFRAEMEAGTAMLLIAKLETEKKKTGPATQAGKKIKKKATKRPARKNVNTDDIPF